MKPPRWWLVGLVVSLLPPLAGGLFFADRYTWVAAESAAAPAQLWMPRLRPETASQHRARLALIRAELERLAAEWATAVRRHRTRNFAWSQALPQWLPSPGQVPRSGQFEPEVSLRRMAVRCAHGSAVLLFDAAWQYQGPGQPFTTPGGRWASGPGAGDPRYVALQAACAGGLVGVTHAQTFEVTVTAGRGAAAASAETYYACAWRFESSAPSLPRWLHAAPPVSSPAGPFAAGLLPP